MDSGKVVTDLGVATFVNGTTAFYRVIPTLGSSLFVASHRQVGVILHPAASTSLDPLEGRDAHLI